MKRELTHCHLRFATSEAYHQPLQRARTFVVERSLEEYAIEETIGAARDTPTAAQPDSPASRAARPGYADTRRPADIAGLCANPLRDEPHPALVKAVTRFGVVGLVAGALGAALLRWSKALIR